MVEHSPKILASGEKSSTGIIIQFLTEWRAYTLQKSKTKFKSEKALQ